MVAAIRPVVPEPFPWKKFGMALILVLLVAVVLGLIFKSFIIWADLLMAWPYWVGWGALTISLVGLASFLVFLGLSRPAFFLGALILFLLAAVSLPSKIGALEFMAAQAVSNLKEAKASLEATKVLVEKGAEAGGYDLSSGPVQKTLGVKSALGSQVAVNKNNADIRKACQDLRAAGGDDPDCAQFAQSVPVPTSAPAAPTSAPAVAASAPSATVLSVVQPPVGPQIIVTGNGNSVNSGASTATSNKSSMASNRKSVPTSTPPAHTAPPCNLDGKDIRVRAVALGSCVKAVEELTQGKPYHKKP